MDSGDGGGGELGGEEDEKEVAVSAGSVEAAQQEDKVAPAAEANGKLAGEVEASDDTGAVGGEEAPEESLEKKADVEDEAAKPKSVNEVTNDGSVDELAPASEAAEPEPVSEMSPEGMNDAVEEHAPAIEAAKPEPVSEASPVVVDGSAEKLATASADNVLEGSHENGQNAENQVASSGAVEDVGAENPAEVEIVAAADTDGILSRELAPESSMENNGDEETEGATEVVDREEEAGDDDIVESVADDDDGVGNEADEDDDGANSDSSPARVAILESSEAAKQIMKELAEGSSRGSVSGSRDYTNSMDGQIMLDDSEEDDDDDDNDDGDEKGFDSAALAALLKAATGGSSDGNITVSSQDGSRIFTMDRPAGLGSSAPIAVRRLVSTLHLPPRRGAAQHAPWSRIQIQASLNTASTPVFLVP
uniref:Uncharacterized protein n=1 Tax=Arundo donax TaxID=35708 RepID=A0A0A9EM26_ARUDO